EPGTVNVIALGELRGASDTDRQRALRDVAAVLEDYPGITAPIEHAEVADVITYEREVTWRGESCRGANDAFTPIAAGSGDAAEPAGAP
ncbi:MAG: hypothetical protein GWO02_13395, partial [Gammaproteobacteria bacterium]|nr:hypothetical protein [Gammaproteobacteria bacterium]